MHAFAMGIPSFRSLPRRRFAWLLWLALLLPVAQAAAACHALSHATTAPDDRNGKQQLLHEGHCDLCLIGAALGGGALPGAAPASLQPAVCHTAPQAAEIAWFASSPLRAYLSRAPPLLAQH